MTIGNWSDVACSLDSTSWRSHFLKNFFRYCSKSNKNNNINSKSLQINIAKKFLNFRFENFTDIRASFVNRIRTQLNYFMLLRRLSSLQMAWTCPGGHNSLRFYSLPVNRKL
jgi:hypothetical protein